MNSLKAPLDIPIPEPPPAEDEVRFGMISRLFASTNDSEILKIKSMSTDCKPNIVNSQLGHLTNFIML